jgi:hypothetical protein
VTIFTDRANRKPHRSTELFKMLANLVHGDSTLLCRVLAQVQSRIDLLTKNAL